VTAETIARALGGRRSGRRWVARCPAHEDRNPSLSLADGEGGKVLVHCFGGCEQERVIEALRRRGLWPERERRPERVLTLAERQRYAQARREAPALARRAAWWLWAWLAQLDTEKLAAVNGDSIDIDRLVWAAREAHALGSASADGVIAAYRRFEREHPAECQRLVAAGRGHDAACRQIVGTIIDHIRQAQEELSRAVA